MHYYIFHEYAKEEGKGLDGTTDGAQKSCAECTHA